MELVVRNVAWQKGVVLDLLGRLASENRTGGWFLSRQVLEAWLTNLDRGYEKRMLLAVDGSTQEVVAALPVYRCHRLQAWRIIGDDSLCCPDHLDLISPRERSAEVWRIVLDYLCRSRYYFSLDLNHLDSRCELLSLLPKYKQARGVNYDLSESRPCFRVSLGSEYSVIVDSLSQKMRQNLRRLGARLAGDFKVEFMSVHGREKRLGALKDLVRLHQARWNARGHRGVFADQRFIELIVQLLNAEGSFAENTRVYVLSVDGRAAAVIIGFIYNDEFLCCYSGFDIDLARYSPGMLIFGMVISACVDEGLIAFDFLRGDESYKLMWTKEVEIDRRARLYFGFAGVIKYSLDHLHAEWVRFRRFLGKLLLPVRSRFRMK